MPYGMLVLDDGTEVPFEVEGPYIGPVSDEGLIMDLRHRFDSVIKIVMQTAEKFNEGLKDTAVSARPSRFKIKFGLKLTADAGVVFAKSGTEGSFEITLQWGEA